MVIKNKKWKSYTIITAVFFAFIIVFEIAPDYSADFYSIGEFITSSNNKSELEKCETEILNLTKRNSALRNTLSANTDINNDKNDISSVINYLSIVSRKSYVENYSLRPAALEQKDGLWVLPINIEISGDYSIIYNYIRFIEMSPRIIVIRDLSITPKEKLKDDLLMKTNLEFYVNQ
jgi:Tfp pilus assembly protein PilO